MRGPICLEPKWKYQLSPNSNSTRFCTMLDIRWQGLHEIDDDLVFCSLITPRNDLNIDASSIQYCGYWWREDEIIIIFSEKLLWSPSTTVRHPLSPASTIALIEAQTQTGDYEAREDGQWHNCTEHKYKLRAARTSTSQVRQRVFWHWTPYCVVSSASTAPYRSLEKWHNISAIK